MARRVLTFVLVGALAAGCGAGQGHASRVPTGPTYVIHSQRDGSTLRVAPGTTLRFDLDGGGWTLASYPRRIMRLDSSSRGATFVLAVRIAGSGMVVARSGQRSFRLRVNAAWTP